MAAKKNKYGAPTTYSEKLADEIVVRCMDKSLYQVCKAKDMPARSTVNLWLAKYKDFSDKYARACKIRRENRFESIDEVIDSEEDVQRARLKVDVIKWQLSKEEPRKYGDKIDMTSGGDKIIPTFQVATQKAKKELEKLYEGSDSSNS